jgi:hypothetical protein
MEFAGFSFLQMPALSLRLNALVSAEIGAVAPLSDTHSMSGGSGMEPSSRDRISVDLHGLKAALLERARTVGVSPSVWVRTTLAQALGEPGGHAAPLAALHPKTSMAGRVRLTLRMTREQAVATTEAARQARMTPGDFVADLVAGVPAVTGSAGRADYIATLVASCAELSTFSRNLNHLAHLLRQGAYRPADEYRPMLNTLGADVRAHLALATRALADLRPRRGTGVRSPSTAARTPGAAP